MPAFSHKQKPSGDLEIGERLNHLRSERKLTLDQLAALTGFTKGYLSKIESSKNVPPISSLARIAQALDTDLPYFFQSSIPQLAENVSVVRVLERRAEIRGASAFGYDYASLAHKKRNKHMEPFVFTFPSLIDKHVFFEHEGEEFLFILTGRVGFQVGTEKFILEPGDSVYFDSRVPHKGHSMDGEATALVVIYHTQ